MSKHLVLLLSALSSGVQGFATPSSLPRGSSLLRESQSDDASAATMEVVPPAAEEDPTYYSVLSTVSGEDGVGYQGSDAAAAAIDPINGWVPDNSKPCYGLPGAVAPTGYFDPLGFCRTGIPVNDVKRYREAEVQHGRVAMLASVGYLAGEAISGPFSITGPANDQLQQVPLPAFALLTAAIAAAELKRATIGWVEPALDIDRLWALRENYYPGDIGFDPLGWKPTDPKKFSSMQTRELQNGRLAMIGVAGMCAQELCNHKTIFDTIVFYQKVYSGINPYE